MTETITVNAVDRSSVIQRKNVEWSESAYLGEIGEGHFQIDDAAGNISIPGWKPVSVEQSSSTPARIFTGFTHKKSIRRGETYQTGAGREIEVATVDLNDLLKRYIIQGTGAANGNRPAETVDERIAWLLASDFLSTLVADFGAVDSSSVALDKSDCRGKYPADVIGEMAKAIRFNYYVRYKSGETLGELVFRDDNTSTDDTCTLSISNALSDVNLTTVFPPFEDAELSQDPEDVYSGAYATHGKGRVYRTRAATATAFTARDGVTEDSSIRKDDTAERDADTFLFESKTEEQILPVTLRLRAAKVGLVQAGQRISTRMTHMAVEGWDPAIYARILRKRVTQPLNTDNDYDVHLELSPQEAADIPGDCVDVFPSTPSGTIYPLGALGDGFHANASDGQVYYLRPGIFYPTTPTVGAESLWHFPEMAAGGAGTSDYAGDCVGNELRFIVVGNGTMTVQTERYFSGARALQASLETRTGTGISLHSLTSGDSVEIPITDATDGDCIRIVRIFDVTWPVCGGKWGWSQRDWVAA